MNFTNYYLSKIKRSPDDDRTAIIAGFKEIIATGASPKFRLMSYYKGLPISYPATIVDLHAGALELDVHQQQAVALQSTKRVFIKCDYFESPILAEVLDASVLRMTATLKNFSFVEIMAERRSALRLQLEPATDAEINCAGVRIAGKLIDISLGGFSIRTEGRCPFGRKAQVVLRVMVPNLLQNTLSKIETEACHIETINEAVNDICRFSFESDQQSEAVISRFIFQRQVEIIREIKEAS